MKIQQLQTELKDLLGFLEKDSVSDIEVIRWVSHCAAFFTKIHMQESVISSFLGMFAPFPLSEKNEGTPSFASYIGPFVRGSGDGGYSYRKRSLMSLQSVRARMIYVDVAFETAKVIIEDFEESQQLVPKSLITFFEKQVSYSHIYSSLKLMEQNFVARDADGLSKNSMTLLESILELESTLKGKDLSMKLRNLCADPKLLNQFGVRKEIIHSLDNSRLVRNQLSAHKDIPIEYNIPFAVALGMAYLVVMFLQITMATGILII